MADIRSTAAEIRRGEKKKKKIEGRKETTGQKYNAPLLHRAAIKRYTKKPKYVTCHVFAETTHVVAAPCGFACEVIPPT